MAGGFLQALALKDKSKLQEQAHGQVDKNAEFILLEVELKFWQCMEQQSLKIPQVVGWGWGWGGSGKCSGQ